MKLRIVCSAMVAVALILPGSLNAQTSRVGGDLYGTVLDSSGAAVPGAIAVVRNTSTNQSRSQLSDAEGRFQVWELPSGSYRLTVTGEGFKPYETSLAVSVGVVSNIAVELVPASVSQQLTVSAEPTAIEPTQTAVATTIDPERIEELPVRSRNYLNFALLAPGVTASNQGASPNSLSLPESGFSFGGLRPRSNAIYIDGVDNNDEFTGASRTELSLETVREFQVVNQGLSAEAGGAAGGSINVVSKTGANTLHGDAFLFVENGSLDARPALEGGVGKPDLNRYRVGVSVGGPIKRDRTFYYTAFEQEHARGQAASDIAPATIAALNPFLAAGNVRGMSRLSDGFFPVTRAETEASAKVDHQLTSSNLLSLRYSFTNNREANDAFNNSALVDFSARGSSFTEDQAFAGGFTSLFGANRVNDVRFQVATRRVDLPTADQTGAGVLIPGVVEFGRPYAGNSLYHENHYEVSDTFSEAYGRHLFKAGLTLNRIHLRASALDGFGALYIFPSIDNLLAGTPAYFQQAFGNPDTNFPVDRYAGFLQDHWMVQPKLTVDIGLRYDFEQLPQSFNEDTNNISPRIGVAFSPSATWVIRSGFGIFFDRYPLAYVNEAIGKNGFNAFDQVVDEFPQPIAFPLSTLGSPLSGIAPSKYAPQPGMANPYSEVATLAVEHAITSNLSASATYSFVRGVKLPRILNTNLALPVTLTSQNAQLVGVPAPEPQQLGRPVFTNQRLDGRYDGIYQLDNEASSSYNGLTLTLNRRLANEFELLASYTVSKAIDDASDFSESPQNPYDLKAERAISLNNQGQRFALSTLFDLPFGEEEENGKSNKGSRSLATRILSNIEMAPILVIGSGRAVNPLTGFDSTRTHTFPLSSRPLVYARNSLITPTTVVFDLRVLKFFKVGEHGKLDFVAESFNLLNRTNVSQVSPWFGAQLTPVTSFARPIEALNPRQLQFSLDFEF